MQVDFVESIEDVLSAIRNTSKVDVAGLERMAVRSPASRDEIVAALNDYAYRCRGTGPGRAARHAVKRIGVITMLEILSTQE